MTTREPVTEVLLQTMISPKINYRVKDFLAKTRTTKGLKITKSQFVETALENLLNDPRALDRMLGRDE